MFIVVKVKCVNSGKISDICDKVNFTTNHTHFTILNIHVSKHIQILRFLTPLTRRSHNIPKNFPPTKLWEIKAKLSN